MGVMVCFCLGLLKTVSLISKWYERPQSRLFYDNGSCHKLTFLAWIGELFLIKRLVSFPPSKHVKRHPVGEFCSSLCADFLRRMEAVFLSIMPVANASNLGISSKVHSMFLIKVLLPIILEAKNCLIGKRS
jgi:hypothetical protein